jgi:hypothetical protein
VGWSSGRGLALAIALVLLNSSPGFGAEELEKVHATNVDPNHEMYQTGEI